MLKKNLKSLINATWAHALIIGSGVTLTMYFMAPYIDFLKDLQNTALIAVAAAFASVAVSKSPAAVVAIIGESKLKNKLSDHAVGIVVILDVVVLILFSLVLSFAKASLDPHSPFSLSGISHLLSEIMASIAAGSFFGLLIMAYFSLINKQHAFFILAISYGVTALCTYLHYDTLLVFVVAGFVVTNFSNQSQKMVETIESLSSIVMIVFFATAGASLHLEELPEIWKLVIALFAARVFFTWCAETLAHTISRSDISLKKYGFTPFISQAGLSIGLAMVLYDRLPIVGPKLATIAIYVVTLNEIIGPILFKWGLNQANKLENQTS